MPPKLKKTKKKATGKKKKGKKSQETKTKTEYEQMLVELNRELATEWQKAVEIENQKIKVEEAHDNLVNDLNDVKQYLAYEIQNEEEEISNLSDHINWLTKKKDEQRDYYEKIIQDMEDQNNKILGAQEEQINNTKTTLVILNHYEQKRQEYTEKEAELTETENRQKENHKQQLYEEEKNLCLEEVPLKQEMHEKLNTIFEPLRQKLSEEGKKERIVQTQQENERLTNKIIHVSEKYLKLSRQYEEVQKKEKEARLDLELLEERILMVEKRHQKRISSKGTVKAAPRQLKFEEELHETDRSHSSSEEVGPEEREADQSARTEEEIFEVEYSSEMEFLKEVELDVLRAIDLEELEKGSDVIYLSRNPEEEEEEKNRLFERRQQLIDELAKRIDGYLNQRTQISVDEKDPPITPKSRKREVVTTKHQPLKRCDLYRNWRMPNTKTVAKLTKDAKLPLTDVSYCKSRAKFSNI